MQLLLQRLLDGDAGKWRTVGRLAIDNVDQALRDSDSLARLFSDIQAMRITASVNSNWGVMATWSWQSGWRLVDTAKE